MFAALSLSLSLSEYMQVIVCVCHMLKYLIAECQVAAVNSSWQQELQVNEAGRGGSPRTVFIY